MPHQSANGKSMSITRDILLLASLWKKIAGNNVKAFAFYSAALLIDSILTAFLATTIAPIADYFLDRNFTHASALTAKYIEFLGALNLGPSLEVFLSIFVLANCIKGISSALLYYVGRRLAYLVLHDLSRECLRSFLSSSLLFFLSYPLGMLQNTLQRETEKLGDGISASFIIAATLVQILILTSVAWVLSYIMVMICLLLVLFFLVITRGLNRHIHHFASLTTSTGNVLVQALLEPLLGAKLILAYGRSALMVAKYSKAYTKHASAAVMSQTLSNAVPTLYQAFGVFSVSLALYVSINSGENLPTLIAALWTLLRIVPLLSQCLANIAFVANVVPSFAQYNELLNAAGNLSIASGPSDFSSFQTGIRLENVAFQYPGRDRALTGVSVFIPKGSFTAFVGESGSGKTTTADMLLRLLAPDSGEIVIDSIPLRNLDAPSFLDRIGYVQQESFLFNTSIRDNLLWSTPNATDTDLWDALRLSNIEQFVRTLPDQMDTIVGDRGVALSGGQRQRIALARALLKKPDILILDEATSALDSDSERLIMESVDAIAPYTTVIAIAHRLSTIARADLVCVFSGGRIVETGSYADLSARPDSRLFDLVTAQNLR